MMQGQPITITIDKAMLAGMESRARSMNVRTAEYVRRLVDAAYMARVGMEKQLPATDAELDEAVRAIFVLSGECSPKAISRATGFPVEMVARVLQGFKIASRMPAAPQEQAATPAAPPAPEAKPQEEAAAPHKPAMRKGGIPPWSKETIETVRTMWAAGDKMKTIATAIGKTEGALSVFASKNRDVCPPRQVKR